jgi:hypothetical protein
VNGLLSDLQMILLKELAIKLIHWDGQRWGGGRYLVLLLTSDVQLEQDALNIPKNVGRFGKLEAKRKWRFLCDLRTVNGTGYGLEGKIQFGLFQGNTLAVEMPWR